MKSSMSLDHIAAGGSGGALPPGKRTRFTTSWTSSSSCSNQRRQQQQPHYPDERIVLNVGGRRFETFVSTLSDNSLYFAAKFSNEWNHQQSQSQQQEEIFIDHDPEHFQVLLSYMRYGYVHVQAMTKEVLLLAEYLGMERLVRAAKLLLADRCGIQGPTPDMTIQQLEQRKGPLQHWSSHDIQNKLLQGTNSSSSSQQDCAFFNNEEPLEFASLYLHKPGDNFPGNFTAPPFRAGLRTMFHRHHQPNQLDNGSNRSHNNNNNNNHNNPADDVLDIPMQDPPVGEEVVVGQPPQQQHGARLEFDELSDKGGFFMPVLALNWLGKHGFQVAPSSLQKFRDPTKVVIHQVFSELDTPTPCSTGQLLDELLFVRRRRYYNQNNYSNPGNVNDTDHHLHAMAPEELATATTNNDHDTTTAATTNQMEDVIITGAAPISPPPPKEYATLNAVKDMDNRVFIQCAGGDVLTIPRLDHTRLRRTGRLHCFNMVSAMEWLRNHGFYTQEPQLEDFLSQAQAQTCDGFYGPTLVFSRTLREQESLLPERYLLGISFKDKIRQHHHRWVNDTNSSNRNNIHHGREVAAEEEG